MDIVLKAAWLVALRSDEYKQAQQVLYNPETNGYCCLGVLCKVMGANFEEVVHPEDSFDEAYTEPNRPVLNGENLAKDSDESLSHEVKDRIGLTLDEESRLIAMNDDEGKTLREIADHIEANL